MRRTSLCLFVSLTLFLAACGEDPPKNTTEEDTTAADAVSDSTVDSTSPDTGTDTGGCTAGSECPSGVCDTSTGECADPTCTDSVQNGDEVALDCGGSCPGCVAGTPCTGAEDCQSGICDSGSCTASTCIDNVHNGSETDTDCGGPDCDTCADGQSCGGNGDCASNLCDSGVCNSVGCDNNQQDGDESDVDCGGSCDPCADGQTCNGSADCASLNCDSGTCLANSCTDGRKNGDESSIDCGGTVCDPCPAGEACNGNDDCASLNCNAGNGLCEPSTCSDGILNQSEGDIDCGGPNCAACEVGKTCNGPFDCVDSYCVSGVCDTATSCLELLTQHPSIPDGTYNIDVDGTDALPIMPVTCDMTTDGGGWMLVLNYLHRAGTNPALNIRSTALPIQKSTTLGDDESADTDAWGHAGNALMDAITFDQTRWYGRSGGHNRVIHFINTRSEVVDYLKTGTGSARPFIFDIRATTLLNATRPTLPLYTNFENSGFSDQGDLAMTEFPFYSDPNVDMGNPRAHWGIKGGSTRWEVDEPSGVNNDTHHQVWVRPDPCADNVQNLNESDVDCGGICGNTCAANSACNTGADCNSGVCTASQCAAPVADCMAIHLADPTTPNGSYTLNVGAGTTNAYCDMTTDGGGWTLMSKFTQHTFINGYPQANYDAFFVNDSWINGAGEGPPTSRMPNYDTYHVNSHKWTNFLTQGEGYELRQTLIRGYDAVTFDVGYDFTYNGHILQNSSSSASTRAWDLTERHVFADNTGILWDGWESPAEATYFWLPFTTGISGSVYSACGGFEFAASGCSLTNTSNRRFSTAGIIGSVNDSNDPAGSWAPHYNVNSTYDLAYVHQNTGVFGATGRPLSLLYWTRPDTCENGQQDANETGVDCGGSSACGGCATAATCTVDTDCASGICDSSACAAPATTCNELLTTSSDTLSGVYTIDPDGSSPMTVYCDMTRDGGGWTMIGKARAGNYTRFSNEKYIDLIAHPTERSHPDLLLEPTVMGNMAFMPRGETNALYHASTGVVRVDVSGNNTDGGNNTSYVQKRINPPADWDFWHAIRDSRLWGDGVSGSAVTGFGTTFTLNEIGAYDPSTNDFAHGGDGSYGWWSAATLTLDDSSSLSVSRHAGLLCDGMGNRGNQWLFTTDTADVRWKTDTNNNHSVIWLK